MPLDDRETLVTFGAAGGRLRRQARAGQPKRRSR